MADCFRQGRSPIWDCARNLVIVYQTKNALGQSYFLDQSTYADNHQTDGSMLISRRFFCFLPGAPLAASMSWGQRSSALLHTISKIACVTLAVGLLALPIGMFPAYGNDLTAVEFDRFWLKILVLASYLMSKVNRYLVYGRVGVKNLAYHSKNKIWSTPCKLSSDRRTERVTWY